MAGHPLVGTWIFDKDIANASDVPSIVVFTADGGLLDPSEGVAGAWQVTGPRSAAWTLIDFLTEGPAGYVVVRSTAEVDAGQHPDLALLLHGRQSRRDGDRLGAGQLNRRPPADPTDRGGRTALAAIPTWTPAPPESAIPTA